MTFTPQTLALVGPTASGKSEVALMLAQHYPLEIISLDSALVYRGMDIGTAKPTPAELALVPHHLIDIRDPAQAYSAAEFAADATRLVADIHARGKHALLVGGTMLYLKALLQPLDDMPPAQPELRAALEEEAAEQGWPALHAQLAEVDPTTAARLSPNDSQRVGRALEVWRSTGRPLSSFHTGSTVANPALGPVPIISLEPNNRTWLHHRIAQRFSAMLAQGLVDEVRGLMQRPDFHPDLPSMRCVGYRQVGEALEANARSSGGTEAAEFAAVFNDENTDKSSIKQEQTMALNKAMKPYFIKKMTEISIAATRQLAKRQLTWLRGMPEREVLACDQPDLGARVLTAVQRHWG